MCAYKIIISFLGGLIYRAIKSELIENATIAIKPAEQRAPSLPVADSTVHDPKVDGEMGDWNESEWVSFKCMFWSIV